MRSPKFAIVCVTAREYGGRFTYLQRLLPSLAKDDCHWYLICDKGVGGRLRKSAGRIRIISIDYHNRTKLSKVAFFAYELASLIRDLQADGIFCADGYLSLIHI